MTRFLKKRREESSGQNPRGKQKIREMKKQTNEHSRAVVKADLRKLGGRRGKRPPATEQGQGQALTP